MAQQFQHTVDLVKFDAFCPKDAHEPWQAATRISARSQICDEVTSKLIGTLQAHGTHDVIAHVATTKCTESATQAHQTDTSCRGTEQLWRPWAAAG